MDLVVTKLESYLQKTKLESHLKKIAKEDSKGGSLTHTNKIRNLYNTNVNYRIQIQNYTKQMENIYRIQTKKKIIQKEHHTRQNNIQYK